MLAFVVFALVATFLFWTRARLLRTRCPGGFSLHRKAALVAAVVALAGFAGAGAQDLAYDAWYAHRCIDHASDIPGCFGGEAGAARKWCESHVYGSPLKTCVQDYLDDGRPRSGALPVYLGGQRGRVHT